MSRRQLLDSQTMRSNRSRSFRGAVSRPVDQRFLIDGDPLPQDVTQSILSIPLLQDILGSYVASSDTATVTIKYDKNMGVAGVQATGQSSIDGTPLNVNIVWNSQGGFEIHGRGGGIGRIQAPARILGGRPIGEQFIEEDRSPTYGRARISRPPINPRFNVQSRPTRISRQPNQFYPGTTTQAVREFSVSQSAPRRTMYSDEERARLYQQAGLTRTPNNERYDVITRRRYQSPNRIQHLAGGTGGLRRAQVTARRARRPTLTEEISESDFSRLIRGAKTAGVTRNQRYNAQLGRRLHRS